MPSRARLYTALVVVMLGWAGFGYAWRVLLETRELPPGFFGLGIFVIAASAWFGRLLGKLAARRAAAERPAS